MTNRGDDCYFFYYSTCTKVSERPCGRGAVEQSLTPACFCRETAAPSDTARRRLAARRCAPSGRTAAASATPASSDTWRSRYEGELQRPAPQPGWRRRLRPLGSLSPARRSQLVSDSGISVTGFLKGVWRLELCLTPLNPVTPGGWIRTSR